MKSLISKNKLTSNYASNVTRNSNHTAHQGFNSLKNSELTLSTVKFAAVSHTSLSVLKSNANLTQFNSLLSLSINKNSANVLKESHKNLSNFQLRNYFESSKNFSKDFRDNEPKNTESKNKTELSSDITDVKSLNGDCTIEPQTFITNLQNNEGLSAERYLKPINEQQLVNNDVVSPPPIVLRDIIVSSTQHSSKTDKENHVNKNKLDQLVFDQKDQNNDNEQRRDGGSETKTAKEKTKFDKSFYLKLITAIGGVISGYIYKDSEEKKENKLDLDRLAEKCSTNYIMKSARANNFKEIHAIERVISTTVDKSFIDVVTGMDASTLYSSQDLTNLLYLINSLSNFYLVKHHDYAKARELLEKGNVIIIKYIEDERHAHLSKSKNFKNLSNENKLKILQEIDNGLPEVYTMSMYLLGRTHIYEGKNKSLGTKYFELSHYLGTKLDLFDSILTIREGFNAIAEEKIDMAVQDGSMCKVAEKEIKSVINTLNELRLSKDETKFYIVGYKLKKEDSGQNTVKLHEDNYHQVECAEQLIKYYSKLIAISKSKVEKAHSLNIISNILFGVDDEHNIDHLGLFKRLNLESFPIGDQKKASVYNTLGNMINVIEETDMEATIIRLNLIKELQLDSETIQIDQAHKHKHQNLISHKIFAKAYSTTINSNFTKTDAYNAYNKIIEKHPELASCTAKLEEPNSLETRIFNDPVTWKCFRQFDHDEDQVNCSGLNDDEN